MAQAAGVISSVASLSIPTGLALDASGNLYVSSQNRVHKVIPAGTVTVIAGTGAYSYSGDGGPATAATFTNAFGLAVDGSGNVYVADNGNNRIRKITPAGVISTVAGTGVGGYSGDGGLATAATLKAPSGVAVDSAGNVYFNDTLNYRVRKIDSAGKISTVAGNGVNGYSGDGGPAASAAIGEAYGVAVDAAGSLYIADSLNNRVRKVDASGKINTLAGNGVKGFAGDGGAATVANLGYPSSVAIDGAGNVLIAEQDNQRVRMVDAAGVISTAAGNGTPAYSGDGGAATSASLSYPSAVAARSAGTFFVADSSNNRVRKVVTVSAYDIVGSWQVPGSDVPPGEIFTFTSDGKYYHAEDTYTPPPRATDMEYGSYSWNPSTGAFSHATTVDTDANLSPDMQVGFSQAQCSKAVVSGNTLTLSCANIGNLALVTSFTLNRVTSATSAIVGGWFIGTPTSNRITTFLSDGTYMSSGNEDPAVTPNGQKGMERGTYTWDATTGAFSSTTAAESDGQWGLSNMSCRSAAVNGDTLTLTCADNATPSVKKTLTGTRVAAPTAATAPAPATRTAATPLPVPPATQAAYTASAGALPQAAVSVDLRSSTYGNAVLVVTLDLSKIGSLAGSLASTGHFAAGYSVYVVALVPGSVLGQSSPTLFMLPSPPGNWAPLGSPMAAYREGIAQSAINSVEITVLQGLDITALVGTEFYIGYGLSSDEMLAASRYRGVYKVQ